MRKLVYLGVPAHGHTNPMLPVIQELVQRGETVICYNWDEFRPQIERTGAMFRAYPTSELSGASLAEVVQGGNLSNATRLILQSSQTLVPFTIGALAAEKPDLVVFDSLALWGKMATTHLRLRAAASITHFVLDERGGDVTTRDLLTILWQTLPQVPRLLLERARLMRHFKDAYPTGQPLFPMRDQLNIIFTAKELHPNTDIIDDTYRFVGPSINPQTRSHDFPFDALGDKPIVYLSLGTVHHAQEGFFKAFFDTFRDYPARFIVSVGSTTNIDTLGTIPPNFIVRSAVPQLEVLQRASVFITHGGMNSIHEGLYFGVPLVVIPHQFEQLLNARVVAKQGAGIVIESQIRHKRIALSEVRQALDTILAQPRYREAAQKVQTMLRATGGYCYAADELQAYIAQD